MKHYSLLFVSILILTISCKKEVQIDDPSKDIPEFLGTWSRTYPINENQFVATYEIDSNSIHYSNKGKGLGNAEYTLERDSYYKNEKRWIGHYKDNFGSVKYYVIFLKDISEENITLYKQKVANPNKAKEVSFPSEDNTDNYGWNTYARK